MSRKPGSCVFRDDDSYIRSHYNNENDEVGYKWDTRIHLLSRYCKFEENESLLVFSKDLSKGDRLTYRVHRPVYDQMSRKWVSKVEYSRCYDHHYENEAYDLKHRIIKAADSNPLLSVLMKAGRSVGRKIYSEILSDLAIKRVDPSDGYFINPSLNELDDIW